MPKQVVERDAQLDELSRLLGEVEAGEGRLLFLSGEAGIGKTVLVQELARRMGGRGRAAIASCDALSVAGALGPLLSIAPTLGIRRADLTDGRSPPEAIFERMLDAITAYPGVTVLVGEDVHRTDEATLKWIRFLGRRLDGVRAFVVFTYRDDVLGPDHPLRVVLGDLAPLPWIRRMALPRLSHAAVRSLAAGHRADPDALFELTGGNPFFVTEVLASDSEELPAGVMDAVLGRAAVLSPSARSVLDAAAVLGPTELDPELIGSLVGGPIEAEIDECLTVGVLEAHGMLLRFRHNITLRAIESVMSPLRSVALNRRALELMRRHPRWRRDHSRLAHHAERAGDAKAVLRHALAAAAEDSALGAHRQAARQYERALRCADGLPASRRADLLERQAHAFDLTGMEPRAIEVQTAAAALRHEIGDPLLEGISLRRLAEFLWHSGRHQDALARARDSLTILGSTPEGPEIARAYATLARVTMFDTDKSDSLRFGRRAIELAERHGASDAQAHAWISVGTARLEAGDEGGFADLERGLRVAREAREDEIVARALHNLASEAIQFLLLPAAERFVSEGLSWCATRDLIGWEHDLLWLRSIVRFDGGDYPAALADAEAVSRASINPPTRLLADIQVAWVRARHGDDVADALDRLVGDVEHATGVWRDSVMSALRAARAEAAYLRGDMPRSLEEARDGYAIAQRIGYHEMVATLALSIHRAGGARPDVRSLPAPVRLQLSGDWRGASARWRELGYPLETARALMEGNEDAVREAWLIFDRLGAVPDARLATARLRKLGSPRIPRGPRRTTRSNPAGLTSRELEVLRLVVEGKRDREIAGQLFLSPRTVAHHVSSILGKLQVSDRAAAAAAATRMGLVQIGQPARAI